MAGGSEWVLPARKMQTSMLPYVNHSTINRALVVVQQGIKHFTVHDLRRTSRTHLAKITNEVIAERCLNHKIKGVGGVYDRYDYFDERKAALTTWANLLDQYDSQGGSNVVPIKASGKR
jgi:integrase